MKTLLFVLLLSVSLVAQTAQVIALSPADAARAKHLHEEAVRAQTMVDAFDKEVQTRYAAKKGWVSSFEYSDDWLFIVPKNSAVTGTITNWGTTTCPLLSVPARIVN